jgi:CheY-like chemotaxis protein
MVLTRLLHKHACEVRSVASGVEALSELEASSGTTFDCVMLDLNMPEMDGITLAKRIRQQQGEAAKLQAAIVSDVSSRSGATSARSTADIGAAIRALL